MFMFSGKEIYKSAAGTRKTVAAWSWLKMKEIKIGCLVKLQKENWNTTEWAARGYDNLVGLVVGAWPDDNEFEILWQGKGKFWKGESSQKTWEYVYALEVLS